MNAFMICNPKQLENEILKRISREKIAHISGANWKIEEYLTIKEFRKILKETPELDVLYMDVTKKDAIAAVEKFRVKNKEGVLLVIADASVSPMEYIKPSVQASSLLLRPFQQNDVVRVVEEIWEWYQSRASDPEECFLVEGIEEEIVVPYDRILKSEAKRS